MAAEHYPGKELDAMRSADNYRRWIVDGLAPHLGKKRGMGRGSVTLYDRVVVPAMRVVENAVRPPIGKNVLLVARRT